MTNTRSRSSLSFLGLNPIISFSVLALTSFPFPQSLQHFTVSSCLRVTSDGALNFQEASKVFFTKTTPRTQHIKDITLAGKIHNQKMERMNGEMRDREKVIRGVKSKQSPVFKGSQIFHNYIRPHMRLDGGKTPAEACGIKITWENKWFTLIQNASTKKE
ncbi:MAG TPA: hypothetical protein VNE86_06505 [Nitrososphaerales archaeon]|nr:hypothetical protein [Nitrososphaerales archaeon]